MANIARSAKSSPDAIAGQFATQFGGNKLGEAVEAGQPLCMDANGVLWKFNNGSVAAAHRVLLAGVATRKATVGEPITPYGIGSRFHMSDGALLVPGRVYFCSATAGEIDDTSVASIDTIGAFYAINKTDLIVINQGKLA
jgi:hypothetical protein